MGSTITRTRRRLGLSLRILMLVVVALACGLAWIANHIRVQRRAVDAIQKAGGFVFYDWERDEPATPSGYRFRPPRKANAKPPGPPWLRKLIGPEMFETVWAVYLQRSRIDDQLNVDDAVIEQVGHLRGVRRLHIDVTSKVTGAMFDKIKDLKNLEFLLCGAAPTDDEFAPVAAMTKLEFLNFNHTNLTDAGMENLRGLTNLKILELVAGNRSDHGKIGSAGLVPLEGLTKLELLNIGNARITSLASLKFLSSLKYLRLNGNPIDDSELEGLANHPTLIDVDLSGSSSIRLTDDFNLSDSSLMRLTDRTMKVLGTIPHLTQISASGNEITDQGLRDIGGLKNLITLKLTNTRVKDFSPLKRMTKLRTLLISREQIDDGNFDFLESIPSLRSMRLEGVRLNDSDLTRVGRMARLSEIALVDAGIDDEKLKYLSGMTALTALNLGRNPITDAGLVHLSGLMKVRTLHLSQTRVTGRGLTALSRPPLDLLDLSGCPLDATGVDTLRKFPTLTQLRLSDTKLTDAALPTLSRLVRCLSLSLQNTNISTEGVAALKKALPKAKIVTESPKSR